jgi:hypothetical protein
MRNKVSIIGEHYVLCKNHRPLYELKAENDIVRIWHYLICIELFFGSYP